MLRYLVQLGLLAAVTAYAFARGGRPERQIAATLCAMAALDLGFHSVTGAAGEYGKVDAFHTLNDLWALAAMLAVALRADRFWTLWVAAFQLIAALSHLVRFLDVEMLRIVYAIIIRAPFWMQIMLVGLGTWGTARRSRRSAAQPT